VCLCVRAPTRMHALSLAHMVCVCINPNTYVQVRAACMHAIACKSVRKLLHALHCACLHACMHACKYMHAFKCMLASKCMLACTHCIANACIACMHANACKHVNACTHAIRACKHARIALQTHACMYTDKNVCLNYLL